MQRGNSKLVEDENGEYNLIIHLKHKPNMDHIETVSGSKTEFYTDFEIADTRRARVQQRRLFFALLGDICVHFIVPTSFLKVLFYTQFEEYTGGKSISLKNETTSSVSDANQLLDLVIDFMFDWHVPFKRGYEILPKDEEYYLYECCRHRVCTICSKHADIHHIDTIGMGGNRTHVNHTKKPVMALCRKHHEEIEQIGAEKFAGKYHVPVEGILLDEETLKNIGIKGKYSDLR